MFLLGIVSALLYVWLYIGSSGPSRLPPATVLVTTILCCAIYHGLFLNACKKLGYSFLTVTCFFFWTFLGLVPMMCSLTGRWIWGDITDESSGTIVHASLLCLLFIGVFYLFHNLAYRRRVLSNYLLTAGTVTDARLFSGVWFSLAISLYVFAALGIEGTFFRAGLESYSATGLMTLFVQTFIRPMPLLFGVPMLWIMLQERQTFALPLTWLVITTVTIALVVNFPLSSARFYGWMVISVLFYYATAHRLVLLRMWLPGAFLMLGFMGSFIVDITRSVKTATELQQNISLADFFTTESFYTGHVDAFEMLVYGTQFVEEKGSVAGKQLLGVAFFWIPRTMWPDKPLATGPLLGTSYINIMLKTENTNLSAPLVLEGYINYGVAGVVFFSLLTGLLLGAMDRALVERRANILTGGRMVVCRVDAIAAPLLGLWIYVLRGSLLPSFAYTCGIILSGLFVWWIFFKRSSQLPAK